MLNKMFDAPDNRVICYIYGRNTQPHKVYMKFQNTRIHRYQLQYKNCLRIYVIQIVSSLFI